MPCPSIPRTSIVALICASPTVRCKNFNFEFFWQIQGLDHIFLKRAFFLIWRNSSARDIFSKEILQETSAKKNAKRTQIRAKKRKGAQNQKSVLDSVVSIPLLWRLERFLTKQTFFDMGALLEQKYFGAQINATMEVLGTNKHAQTPDKQQKSIQTRQENAKEPDLISYVMSWSCHPDLTN